MILLLIMQLSEGLKLKLKTKTEVSYLCKRDNNYASCLLLSQCHRFMNPCI